MTLRQNASDVEEEALNEESTTTRGSLRNSESLKDIYTADFSQSETVGFIEEALEPVDMTEARQGTCTRNVQHFFGEVRIHLVVTKGDYVEPQLV